MTTFPKEEVSADTRILIVDDNEDIRVVIKMMLQKSGYEYVADTDDPTLVMKEINGGGVNLVLMDWKMPEIEGIDLLKAIRVSGHVIPVIMLTSENEKHRVLEAVEAGATDYIVKPCSRKLLVEKIEEALRETSPASD